MCFWNSLIAFVTENYWMIKIHKKYLVVIQEFLRKAIRFSRMGIRNAKLLQMTVFKLEALN